jgi:hypothetical protein
MKTQLTITLETLRDCFDTTTRNNGESIVIFDTPDETLKDFMVEVHGTEMWPDDYRYATIERLICIFLDYAKNSQNYTIENMVEDLPEISDSLVDVYDRDLKNWLSSHHFRAGYCDQAQEEGMTDTDTGILARIVCGQILEIQELGGNLISWLEEYLEELPVDPPAIYADKLFTVISGGATQ